MTQKSQTSKSSKVTLGELSEAKNFDLKFILVSAPGGGKTHMAGTYSGGPIHFYMLDQGGEKTLYKLNESRPPDAPITVDTFNRRDKQGYDSFWKQIQTDGKSGFFDEMAAQNGLVVFDSMTAISQLALDSVAQKNNRTPGNTPESGGMRRQDWGQRSAWITEFIRVVTELPCAVVITCHLKRIQDDNTGSVREQLALPGQLADSGANWFDEVYKLGSVAKSIRLHFRNGGAFDQCKTRVFTDDSVDFKLGEPIMDKLVSAYFSGGKFSEKSAEKSQKNQGKS